MKFFEIEYINENPKKTYLDLIEKTINKCYEEENLFKINMYINFILTDKENIKQINKQHRNVNNITDVLSFPMFEKKEINKIKKNSQNTMKEVLGDVIICIEKVKEQAEEYENSFEREFSYMIVHAFYHLLGYDHIKKLDKIEMRIKEENILEKLNLKRELYE